MVNAYKIFGKILIIYRNPVGLKFLILGESNLGVQGL